MSGIDQATQVDQLVARVARLRADASAVAATDVANIDVARATALHADLRAVTDQLSLAASRLLAQVESDGRWQAGGTRTFPEWVARRHGTSIGAARQESALGRALEADLPRTGPAVAERRMTLEHAHVLARFGPTSEARRAALGSDLPDRNEAFLVDKAQRLGVDDYRREVRRWAARIDAEAAEREHEEASAKEFLTLSRRHDGIALQGFLTTEHGVALETALRAITGVPAADDVRSAEERKAHALTGLTRMALDTGFAGGGAQVRPHLSVHVSWETLKDLERTVEQGTGRAVPVDGGAGSADLVEDGSGRAFLVDPAQLESGDVIARSVLARLACDSEMSRMVFGPDGQVLDVGRSQRTYSGQLRRAIIARDRRCQHPGCNAPAPLGEIHHVLPWSCGGRTSVSNGILLCWFHHELVHRRRLQITPAGARGWDFRRSDGTPLSGRPPDPGSHDSEESPPEHDRQEPLSLEQDRQGALPLAT